MHEQPGSDATVHHAIPGRMRLHAPVLRRDATRSKALGRYLSSQPSIQSADVRPLTGAVIVRYDPKLASQDSVLGMVTHAISMIDSLPRDFEDRESESHPDAASQDSSSKLSRYFKVIAFSGFMLYYLVRTWVTKSTINPVWITAATIATNLPLFQRAASDIRASRFVSAEIFLASGSVLALGTGQAGAALEVSWVREVGHMLEDYVQEKSRRQIRETLIVSAKKAYLLVDGVEVETPAESIQEGDTVVVRASERIPVDGSVSDGEALVDESHITGRAEPEHRKEGAHVYAGTMLQSGSLKIRADKVGHDTYLARIVTSVEEALANRSEAEKKADLLAARLTALGLVCTVATALLTRDLAKTLSVQLAIASPCATVLAASTAVTAALANAARNKVLVKGGLYLERFGQIDCFCFDKTGTVTEGAPQIMDIVTSRSEVAPREVLELAADVQEHNPHPIAATLVQAAQAEGHQARPVYESDIAMGRGVRATLDGHRVLVGNAELMSEEHVDISSLDYEVKKFDDQGFSEIFVSRDGELQGMICVAYNVKPELEALVNRLRKDGVREVHMLSGDKHQAVSKLGRDFGFDGYKGDMLPEEKAGYVENLGSRGGYVAMVGDGINDALALSKARIGIAMGAGGAEAAIQAADIALVDSDLRRLIHVRRLSAQSMKVIEQNHWFAITTDVLGAVLGMMGKVSPAMSGFSHLFHTLVILLNSSRLLAWSLPEDVDEEFSHLKPSALQIPQHLS